MMRPMDAVGTYREHPSVRSWRIAYRSCGYTQESVFVSDDVAWMLHFAHRSQFCNFFVQDAQQQ
jgi:hypothetical protein